MCRFHWREGDCEFGLRAGFEDRESARGPGLTMWGNPLMMIKVVSGLGRPARALVNLAKSRANPLVAPSFNGRTAASGAAYRGSNP